MLDIVLRGDEVAITRYGRPIAVMVEAGKWEAMQDELERLRRENPNGNQPAR